MTTTPEDLTTLGETLSQLLTLREAADLLGVSYDVLSRMAREGKLPVYEVVGIRKVHPDDLRPLVKVPARG